MKKYLPFLLIAILASFAVAQVRLTPAQGDPVVKPPYDLILSEHRLGLIAKQLYGPGNDTWVVTLGDSFNVHFVSARLMYGWLDNDPNLNITAVAVGAATHSGSLIRSLITHDYRQINGANRYLIYEDEDVRMGVPVNALREIRDNQGLSGWKQAFKTMVQTGQQINYPWLDPSDLIVVRPLIVGSYTGHQNGLVRINGVEQDISNIPALGFTSLGDHYLGLGRDLQVDSFFSDSDMESLNNCATVTA